MRNNIILNKETLQFETSKLSAKHLAVKVFKYLGGSLLLASLA